MNSMVVQLFSTHAANLDEPPLHASEVALEGYCGFHHLLLHAAQRWPEIRQEANRRLEAFLSSERGQSKDCTPDLGRLLVTLTLSGRGWEALCYPFLREMLARNVRWVLQKKPFLLATAPPHAASRADRAIQTFDASLTALRLVAFQISFLQLIGRPAGTAGPQNVCARYDRRLGKPTAPQRAQLQVHAKRVLKLSSWTEFFLLVGANVPSADTLHELLVGALHTSARRGYHAHGSRYGRHGAGKTTGRK